MAVYAAGVALLTLAAGGAAAQASASPPASLDNFTGFAGRSWLVGSSEFEVHMCHDYLRDLIYSFIKLESDDSQ